MLIQLILNKILLGITLAAPVGPVSIEMIKRGLNNGFSSAFKVRLGGAMGDFICLLFAYYGLTKIADNKLLINFIGFFGSLFLIYLGYKSLRNKNKLDFAASEKNNTFSFLGNNSNVILIGLFLALVNPVSIVFWFGIFAANMASEVHKAGIWINIFILVGVLIWGMILSGFLEICKRNLKLEWIRLVNKIAGFVLIVFGLNYFLKFLDIFSSL